VSLFNTSKITVPQYSNKEGKEVKVNEKSSEQNTNRGCVKAVFIMTSWKSPKQKYVKKSPRLGNVMNKKPRFLKQMKSFEFKSFIRWIFYICQGKGIGAKYESI